MLPIAAQAAITAAGSLASLVGSASSSAASSTDTSAQSTKSQAAKSGDTVTQADFMQLLIAQLQNQDPLNPLDSANFFV